MRLTARRRTALRDPYFAAGSPEANYWRRILLTLFLYRCAFSVIAETVIPDFTKVGDAGSYQLPVFSFDGNWYRDSNDITSNIGALFNHLGLGSDILVNLGFQSLAFLGMRHLLLSLDPTLRLRLLLLFFFPSFTLWSSVAGKEAVLVFAVSYLSAYLVGVVQGGGRLRPIHLLSAYVVLVFKPYYLAALAFTFFAVHSRNLVRQAALMVLAGGTISLILLYLVRDIVSELSFAVLPHFVGFGRSTREVFWVEAYDILWKAPQGMVLGFFGPTLEEALRASNVLHIITFFEGVLMLGVFLYYMFRNFPRLPVFGLLLSLFALFWILFATYPFGVMNPGSAVRYRTGYIVFVFTIFSAFLSPRLYQLRLPLLRRRPPPQDSTSVPASSPAAG